MQDIQIDKKMEGDIAIFYPKSDIDFFSSPKVEKFLLEEIERNNLTKVIVNLSDVRLIDSSGIGVLLGISHKHAGKIQVRICNIQNTIIHVLKFTGLGGLVQMDPTEADSIKKLQEA